MNNLEYLKIKLPEDILKLKAYGDFNGTFKAIDLKLNKKLPKALAERLQIEKIIIQELQKQYSYSYDDALKKLHENIRDFKDEELVKLKDDGFADWIFADGKITFQNSFFENIIKTCPSMAERLLDKNTFEDRSIQEKLLNDTIEEMKTDGSKAYFIHIKASVKIKKSSEKPGETIKVHIPVPAQCMQTKNIKILNTIPEAKFINEESCPQRTAYFEKPLEESDEFSVEYSYENHVKYTKPEPEKVCADQPDFYTSELEPHIRFTPYIKELLKEITGSETNPLIKARKIYDFITTKVKYSFVREYLTIENISEYAAVNLKGDCGVQALLFITLCRCANIPARWQSGLYVNPYHIGNHDWAQFYIAPYGWLFADCSFGGSAYRSGCKERWDFYFGNLDPFRMPANSEFQYAFNPKKSFLRADPYDNQRGECEYEDSRLTFDDFDVVRKIVGIHEL